MKAIVVVFFRTRRPKMFEELLSLRETGKLAAPANSVGETPVPPFWTWFIKNPRFPQGNSIAV